MVCSMATENKVISGDRMLVKFIFLMLFLVV